MLLWMMMLHHVLLRIVHSLLGSVRNDARSATRKYLHLGVIAWSGSHLGVESTGYGTSSALWLHAVGCVAGVRSGRDGAVAGLLHVLLLLLLLRLLLLLLSGGGIARTFSRVYRGTVFLSWRTSLGRHGWHGLMLLGGAIRRWILLAHLGMLGIHDGHHARHSKLRTTRSHIPHHGRSRIFPMRIMHHLSLFHHWWLLLLLHRCRRSRSRSSKRRSERFGTGIE